MSYIVPTAVLACTHRGVFWKRPNGAGALPAGDGGVTVHCWKCGEEQDVSIGYRQNPADTEVVLVAYEKEAG